MLKFNQESPTLAYPELNSNNNNTCVYRRNNYLEQKKKKRTRFASAILRS